MSDKEFRDEDGPNYLDLIAKQQQRDYLCWQLVEGLRDKPAEDRLRQLLGMRTGDLTDGTANGLYFVRERCHYVTKALLRKHAKKGDIAVFRPTRYAPVQKEIERLRLGVLHDGKQAWNVALAAELIGAVWDLGDRNLVSPNDFMCVEPAIFFSKDSPLDPTLRERMKIAREKLKGLFRR